MKKLLYILTVVFCLVSCNKSDTKTENIAKSNGSPETVIVKNGTENVTYMQIYRSEESTTIKWKIQPKGENESRPSLQFVGLEDPAFTQSPEGIDISIDPAGLYYFIPADNPAAVLSVKGNGADKMRVKCKCKFNLSQFEPGKCSASGYVVQNVIQVSCFTEAYCLDCETQIIVSEKLVSFGSGLLINAQNINVIPL